MTAAYLDGDRLLLVRFTRRMAVADWPASRFGVMEYSGQRLAVDRVEPLHERKGRAARFNLHLRESPDFTAHHLEVEADGLNRVAVRPRLVLQDPERYGDADATLGAGYAPTATTFRVFAPLAHEAFVVIADEAAGDAGRAEHLLEPMGKGIWETSVAGDLAGRYYAYRLTGVHHDPNAEIVDIYATCTQGRHDRSLIVDPRATDPPGFREYSFHGVSSPADAIIYEMHVRDFTVAEDSGVQQRGKFLGLPERGTHLSGDPKIKTGLDHLIELGVTHVQLMPIQDFDNDEEREDEYHWGYMPAHFNSPDGWYASRMLGADRIRECKQAIQALHEHGIGVIMDVVYNHTSRLASFERLVPGYYFRQTPAGRFANGSGCGNEFRSESPMARRFILDSLRYWVREYKVDGFRFDLMGLMDLETMKQIRDELTMLNLRILLYGEPWTGGRTPLSPITDKQQVRGTGIGAFNDHFRDAIKGDRDGGPPGFVQVGDHRDGIVHGLAGAIEDWAVDPTDAINYFEAHDNLTAWDKLLQSVPDASEDDRRRMMRFAALILFCSQGVAFLHSGQEFCRTKQGNHNSYNAPDNINRIDWSLKKQNRDVFEYHRGMIGLRKAHPLLRLLAREEVEQRISFPEPPADKCVICRLGGENLEGEFASQMLVLLNGHTKSVKFDLPEGDWAVHADADRAAVESLGQVADRVSAPAHSGMLLMH